MLDDISTLLGTLGGGSAVGGFGVYAQGIGAVTSAIGAYYSAASQRSSLAAAAGVDDINAVTAERTAQAALLAGQHEQQSIELNTDKLKSRQTANMAANGVDIGSAGAANVLTSTDVLGAIDANTANANAVRAAWGYRTQATNYANDALNKRAADGAISPFLSGASSLLGGAGQVASSWYRLNKPGMAPTNYGSDLGPGD